MKKLFFLLLLPFAIFAQQTTLIGDVDCNGSGGNGEDQGACESDNCDNCAK